MTDETESKLSDTAHNGERGHALPEAGGLARQLTAAQVESIVNRALSGHTAKLETSFKAALEQESAERSQQLESLTARVTEATTSLEQLDIRLERLADRIEGLGERITNAETRLQYVSAVGGTPSPLEPARFSPSGHALLEPTRTWRRKRR